MYLKNVKAHFKHLPFKHLPLSGLADQIRFLSRLLISPRTVGAIAPSGHKLADAMMASLPHTGPILELGPGSGAFTRALLDRGLPPSALTLVERDPEFIRTLKKRFPGVQVIHGDALQLAQILPRGDYAGVISGLPLLNFPLAAREKLIRDALAHMQPGAPFVQFSYGWRSPVSPSDDVSVTQSSFVWNNLPPARVWVYRQK